MIALFVPPPIAIVSRFWGGHEYVLLRNAAVTYRRADVRLVAVNARGIDVAIPDA
jgi:hypothetical protein